MATLPSIFLLHKWTRVSPFHSAALLSDLLLKKILRHHHQFFLLQTIAAPSDIPDYPRVFTPRHLHLYTSQFLFLHETVSQSKVSCSCWYCLTIIAILRSNFTIFGSYEPTIIHLCTKCHHLSFSFCFSLAGKAK